MPRSSRSSLRLSIEGSHFEPFHGFIFFTSVKLTREQGVRLDTKAKKEGNLFGLGRGWYITDKETEAILFAMDWDGTPLTPEGASIPYKLTKEWFQLVIT